MKSKSVILFWSVAALSEVTMGRNVAYSDLFLATKRCVGVKGQLAGSGVIIREGLVFTNLHLIGEATELFVDDNKVFEVICNPFWASQDFAALRVDTADLPPLKIYPKAYRGQKVFYVGNPGEKCRAIQLGRVKASNLEQLEIFIETEEGASGSGVYNNSGLMIALMDSFDPPENGIGCLGYAIPGWRLQENQMFIEQKLGLRD